MSLRLAVGCKSAEQQRGHMPTPEGQGLMDHTQPDLVTYDAHGLQGGCAQAMMM